MEIRLAQKVGSNCTHKNHPAPLETILDIYIFFFRRTVDSIYPGRSSDGVPVFVRLLGTHWKGLRSMGWAPPGPIHQSWNLIYPRQHGKKGVAINAKSVDFKRFLSRPVPVCTRKNK